MIQILIPMEELGLRIEHRKVGKVEPPIREGGNRPSSQTWAVIVDADELGDTIDKLLMLTKRLQGYARVTAMEQDDAPK